MKGREWADLGDSDTATVSEPPLYVIVGYQNHLHSQGSTPTFVVQSSVRIPHGQYCSIRPCQNLWDVEIYLIRISWAGHPPLCDVTLIGS